VTSEAARAIGYTNPGAKDEGLEHGGGIGGCHQVHQGIISEVPFLARQLSVFYRQAYLGIP